MIPSPVSADLQALSPTHTRTSTPKDGPRFEDQLEASMAQADESLDAAQPTPPAATDSSPLLAGDTGAEPTATDSERGIDMPTDTAANTNAAPIPGAVAWTLGLTLPMPLHPSMDAASTVTLPEAVVLSDAAAPASINAAGNASSTASSTIANAATNITTTAVTNAVADMGDRFAQSAMPESAPDLPPGGWTGTTGPAQTSVGGAALPSPALNTAQPQQLREGLQQQLQWMLGPGNTPSAKLVLQPEALGTLRIEIIAHATGTRVSFLTDSVEAQRLIADALPELRQMLDPQGTRPVQATVSSATTEFPASTGGGDAFQKSSHDRGPSEAREGSETSTHSSHAGLAAPASDDAANGLAATRRGTGLINTYA